MASSGSVPKWHRRIRLNKISRIAILLCLALSITLAGFTFYGNKVGNFVISLGQAGKGLVLSVHSDPMESRAHQSVLQMDGLRSQTNGTFYNIINPDIVDGMGSKNAYRKGVRGRTDGLYIAFSFWLINMSSTPLNYQYKFTCISPDPSPSGTTSIINAARVCVIENDGNTWSKNQNEELQKGETYGRGYGQPGDIYKADEEEDTGYEAVKGTDANQRFFFSKKEKENYIHHGKTEDSDEKEDEITGGINYKTKPFHNKKDWIIEKKQNFLSKYSIKYTFIIWLEGWDKDCNNDLYEKTMKMKIDFSLIE